MRGNSHNVCNAVRLMSVMQATREVVEVKTPDKDLPGTRFPLKGHNKLNAERGQLLSFSLS